MDPNEFKPKLLFFSRKGSISRGADGFSSEDEVIDGLYDTKKKACSDKNAETLSMNVVLFSSDRTAVNSSWNPEIIAKLKELNNYLVAICSVSHRLKLALKDAMKNWFESVDTCICNLYYLYKKSAALSIGPFQNVQGEVIYFPYVVRKNEKPLDIVQKF